MVELLEIIAAVGEVLFSWRFFICIAFALGAVAAVYWFVPDRTLCLGISIPVAAVGLIGGFIWQWRSDKV